VADRIEGVTRSEEDAGAIERSYRANAARLWRSLLLFSGSVDVADEALAEAFAQAVARGGAIRNVDAWTWQAAFKIAGGELQRRHALAAEVLPDLPVEMPQPTVDLVKALRSLAPRQREALILHHYAGYSTKEVARILGSTAPGVGMLLDRGRRKLRPLLEERHE
jgi:RNA polymerase sigma-70 factor (ECF subfamily)